MSFTRRLMAHGDFQLPIIAGTPRWLRRIFELGEESPNGFCSVVCTPARYSLDDIDADDLLDLCQFVGFHRMNDGLVLSGPGVEAAASDELGKYTGSAPSGGTRTFSQWITEITTSSSGVVDAGSVEAISGNVTWTPEYPIATLDALDYICTQKGAEWRVNNDLTVDAGTITHLYSTTPQAIVGAVGRGGLEPGGYRGIVGKVSKVEHLEDYAYSVHYLDSTDGSILGGANRSSAGFHIEGTQYKPVIALTDGSNTIANQSARATARLVYGDDTLKRTYRVEGLGTSRPLEHIGTPGEYLYVFDPAELLLDKANQIVYRGAPVWPIKLRIIAVTTPLRRGQGWYYRYQDGVSVATVDITDFVDWAAEAGTEPAIEVGHPSASWARVLRARYEDLTRR